MLNHFDDETVRCVISLHHVAMDYLRDVCGGFDVFPDEIVEGDFSSLRQAAQAAHLPWREGIAEAFVEPAHWHFKA